MKPITMSHLKKWQKSQWRCGGYKSLKIFSNYDLAAEGWCEFKYKIDSAPSWSEFDFELIVFSTRDNVKLLF